MKLGSLFDGSGTAPLAAAMNGITPVWASEVEPYPILVTKTRFPNMQHLGSITEIKGNEVVPVDIICGGSPCQDLSVAGRQAGLEGGTRSHLFFEMTRIIKEMREATNGKYPRYIIWENVPGAFSSNNGYDFLYVLQSFAEIAEADVHVPEPERKADRLIWQYAGEMVGNGWSIAWRTVDAQYWGVPQRRRRIYLVADFDSERAGEILFERDGMSGNPEQGGETRKGSARAVEKSTGRDYSVDISGNFCYACNTKQQSQNIEENPSNTLGASDYKEPQIVCYPSIARTLTAEHDASPCIDRGQNVIVSAFMGGQGAKAHGIAYCDDGTTPTLKSTLSGSNTVPDVCYCLQGNGIDHADTARCNGAGWRENESYTLNTIDRPAVCYTADCRNAVLNTEISGTLQAKPNGGFSYNCINPVVYPGVGITSKENKSNPKPGDAAPTLDTDSRKYLVYANSGLKSNGGDYSGDPEMLCVYDARGNGDAKIVPTLTDDHNNRITDYTAICVGNGQVDQARISPLVGALNCMHDQQIILENNGKSTTNYIVRRLTPLECCRLQGFPDWWESGLAIENPSEEVVAFWRDVFETHRKINNPNGKPKTDNQIIKWLKNPYSDSASYKMWGNGMALPNMMHVMKGIVRK